MTSQGLDYITIRGFKSIASVEKLPLRSINVIIGPNGSGKSNFIGSFESPEEINDSPTSAPSVRVRRIIPNYEKPLMGTLAIIEIGLERIRCECPHFNEWLGRLERLVK